MEERKQKHLLEILISSNDVFSRCISIIKPEYFQGNLQQLVRFITEYFDKYKTLPEIDTLAVEYADISLEKQVVTNDKISYACDEIEKFCKEQAVVIAMNDSIHDLENGEFGAIVDRMQDAVTISLKKDLGWDFFGDNFSKRLEEALSQAKTISTGIAALDKYIGGGLSRQQTTIFTANSGVGKSIMLNNLAHNYAVTGHNVVLLSLELPVTMIFNRTAAIVSGFKINSLGENKLELTSTIENIGSNVAGSIVIQRLRGDANCNDIRSYLTHYAMERGHMPECLIVDYLDKMTPNQGIGRLGISEQDKFKSEQLAEIMFDYDMIGISASQQNREAIGNPSPRQDVIAGGLTKANTVDNMISLYMDEQMRLRGEMVAHFLKTRSADGVGKTSELYFDTGNLRICDPGTASNRGIFDISKRSNNIISNLPGLEYEKTNKLPQSDILNFMENLENG